MSTLLLSEDKTVEKKIESADDECSICFESLKNSKVVLNCKHIYHYNCIYDWYMKTINSQHGAANSGIRECPYCRKHGGYLPYNSDKPYHKHIHGPRSLTTKRKTSSCKGQTKLGNKCRNKGTYHGYCHIHKKST